MIDAIEEQGPQRHRPRRHAGDGHGASRRASSSASIGGHGLDLNGSINDFSIGLYETFGRFSPVSSADDWFNSEIVLIWHMNPIYTRIPFYHFIAEARYNGAEVINISPDVNPSHLHADMPGLDQRRHGPGVRPGDGPGDVRREHRATGSSSRSRRTSATSFARTTGATCARPTSRARAARTRCTSGSPARGLKLADRGNIFLNGADIALEGIFDVKLADGSTVQVHAACDSC